MSACRGYTPRDQHNTPATEICAIYRNTCHWKRCAETRFHTGTPAHKPLFTRRSHWVISRRENRTDKSVPDKNSCRRHVGPTNKGVLLNCSTVSIFYYYFIHVYVFTVTFIIIIIIIIRSRRQQRSVASTQSGHDDEPWTTQHLYDMSYLFSCNYFFKFVCVIVSFQLCCCIVQLHCNTSAIVIGD